TVGSLRSATCSISEHHTPSIARLLNHRTLHRLVEQAPRAKRALRRRDCSIPDPFIARLSSPASEASRASEGSRAPVETAVRCPRTRPESTDRPGTLSPDGRLAPLGDLLNQRETRPFHRRDCSITGPSIARLSRRREERARCPSKPS